MKVANLLLVYRDPGYINELIRSLSHPDFDFYIHLDKKSSFKDFAFLQSGGRANFIKKRVQWHWGGYCFVQAVMNSIDEIIASGVQYDFINLLSNQDFPIREVNEIHAFLKQNKGKSFISYEKYPSPWWDHAIQRIKKLHLTDFPFKGKTRLERLLGLFIKKRRFPFPFELFGGPKASYWTISYEAALYLHRFFRENRSRMKFFKYTWAPDEFLFVTILLNSPLKHTVENNSLRYIDWTPGRSHPNILRVSDMDKIKYSGQLFARKFDRSVDPLVIAKIDAELLHHEPHFGI